MITLCFDFGNTRLKMGVFENDNFVESVGLVDDTPDTIQELLNKYQPSKTILSSVIEHNKELESLLLKNSLFHKVTFTSKVPFTTPVNKPETIGADRIALIAAAVHYYNGFNTLIIALGSCITYNFVNQYNQFLGGGISPGMDMRFRSMHQFTAKLPLVSKGDESGVPLIGYDTKTNLQSGVLNGMTCEIDGIINKYTDRYCNFNAVLTGGNSTFFASQLKNKIFADSNFLFKGLYALSELNNCSA